MIANRAWVALLGFQYGFGQRFGRGGGFVGVAKAVAHAGRSGRVA